MQRDSDIADSGEPRIVLHCEKKHEYICSSASTSLKNSLLVWDRDQRARVNSLNNSEAGFFSHSIKIHTMIEYVNADLWEYVFIVKI